MKNKKDLTISCIGHKKVHKIYKFDEKVTRSEIHDYLERLQETYNLTILTKWEKGSCELFVEEATKLGITTVFVIPEKRKKAFDKYFKRELRLHNYADVAVKCSFIEDNEDDYLINESDEILCLWSGSIKEKEIIPVVSKAMALDKRVTFF